MKACRFSCPNCSAPLRVKDRSFVGQEIACPDCSAPLQIVADGSFGVVAKVVDQPLQSTAAATRISTANSTLQQFVGKISSAKATRGARWLSALQSPVGVAWSVAGGFALVLIAAVGPFRRDAGEVPNPALPTIASTLDGAATNGSASRPVTQANAESEPSAGSRRVVQPVENPPSPAASPDDDVAAAESLGKGTAPVTTQAAPAEQLEIEVVNAPVGRQPAPKLPEPLFPAAVPPDANAEQTKTLQTAEAADANVPHPQAAQSGVTIVARVAPEAVDPRAALSQRILRFRQPEPVPFSKLLVQVEELAGVPLRYEKDVLSAETLKTPVTLDLSMTTVGDILTALLRQVGLAHEVDKDGIRLRIAD